MDGLKEKKYVHTKRKRFDPFAMVCGIGLILYIISSLSSGGNWQSFWDVRSLFVVFGGHPGKPVDPVRFFFLPRLLKRYPSDLS